MDTTSQSARRRIMKYKIIADSSCELPADIRENGHFSLIPFGMEINGYHVMDNEDINIEDFLKRIADSPTCPKSSCPAPQTFMDQFETDAERIYVITISSKLSGCYNSAVLAKTMFEEQNKAKKIFVIDSLSASCGESQIALLAMDLEEKGIPFEDITKQLEAYRDHLNTFFVLDNIETLRKNGRMSGVKALVASTLNIKPVLAGDKGSIVQLSQAIGIKKALVRMVDHIASEVKNAKEKRIIITHCNNPLRAECVKKMLQEKTEFEHFLIMSMSGLSSLYANDGGIIVTY